MENENINPWVNLWVKPRETIRKILNTDPKRLILWLAILAGICASLTFTAYSWYPPRTTLHASLLIGTLVILGALFGIIHLYFTAWLLTLTGSWVGGKGNFIDVKCAVGWSNYPFIVADIFAFLMVVTKNNVWLTALCGLLYLIALTWAFVIFLKIIGEAHKFSAWKAILALFMAFVLVFVAMIIIALLVPLLTPLFK